MLDSQECCSLLSETECTIYLCFLKWLAGVERGHPKRRDAAST